MLWAAVGHRERLCHSLGVPPPSEAGQRGPRARQQRLCSQLPLEAEQAGAHRGTEWATQRHTPGCWHTATFPTSGPARRSPQGGDVPKSAAQTPGHDPTLMSKYMCFSNFLRSLNRPPRTKQPGNRVSGVRLTPPELHPNCCAHCGLYFS